MEKDVQDIYTCSRCGKQVQKTYVMPQIELKDNEIVTYHGDTRLCRSCAEIVIHEYNSVRDMITYEPAEWVAEDCVLKLSGSSTTLYKCSSCGYHFTEKYCECQHCGKHMTNGKIPLYKSRFA